MAVPKRKVSKSRSSMRNANNSKLTAPTLTECKQCKTKIMPHTVCSVCGYYNGVKRIETKADVKAKKAAAAAAANKHAQ